MTNWVKSITFKFEKDLSGKKWINEPEVRRFNFNLIKKCYEVNDQKLPAFKSRFRFPTILELPLRDRTFCVTTICKELKKLEIFEIHEIEFLHLLFRQIHLFRLFRQIDWGLFYCNPYYSKINFKLLIKNILGNSPAGKFFKVMNE